MVLCLHISPIPYCAYRKILVITKLIVYQKINIATSFFSKKNVKVHRINRTRWAVIAGLSTAYFRKLFVEVMGTTPLDYLHKIRIKKAKEMLKSDYGSITDIAHSLGYLNIYGFSRDFKKYTGVPPSKY